MNLTCKVEKKFSNWFLGILIIGTFLISCKIPYIYGYERGAPERVCESMKPGHGEATMASEPPFTIKVDKKWVPGGGKIRISVESKIPKQYTLRGALFIMKRPNDKRKAFGSFEPQDKDLQTLDCFGKVGSRSGITHSDNSPKRTMAFNWFAPNVTKGEFELHATLVRDFNSYWIDYIYPHKIIVATDETAADAASKEYGGPSIMSQAEKVSNKPVAVLSMTVLVIFLTRFSFAKFFQ